MQSLSGDDDDDKAGARGWGSTQQPNESTRSRKAAVRVSGFVTAWR